MNLTWTFLSNPNPYSTKRSIPGIVDLCPANPLQFTKGGYCYKKHDVSSSYVAGLRPLTSSLVTPSFGAPRCEEDNFSSIHLACAPTWTVLSLAKSRHEVSAAHGTGWCPCHSRSVTIFFRFIRSAVPFLIKALKSLIWGPVPAFGEVEVQLDFHWAR